jgi:serine/threonine protein kinase
VAQSQPPAHDGKNPDARETELESIDQSPSAKVEYRPFAERYEDMGEIGSGGMGRVVKARDRQLDRIVAVKRVNGELAPELLARFLLEAQFLAKLNHPNLVTIYDIARDDEGPYLVMEYVEGESLAERLKRGPIALDEAVRILLEVCAGVMVAHQVGIIHRDIKPQNIILMKNGKAKLVDFGIARQLDATDGDTNTGQLLGTLDFMAPEQFVSSKTAEKRSDLFSLAATFYNLVTRISPRYIHSEELPGSVRAVVMKALKPKLEDRQQSVKEFSEQLRQSVSANTVAPTPVVARVVAPVVSTVVKPVITPLVSPVARGTFAGVTEGDSKELGVGMRFRWCPPTAPKTFLMGTPGDTGDEAAVSVRLTQGFWLGETVVTQSQWQAVMKSAPWKGKDYVKEGSDYPASYISHGDAGDGNLEADSASDFCDLLTELERKAGRLPADWRYQLPTEAQWEYACRAGTPTKFYFGNNQNRLDEYGWFDKNAKDAGEQYAHRVGLKLPNDWGLLDMYGNLWEWCRDWYQIKLPGGDDPVVLSKGSYRVSRGGCWYYAASDCRSAYRSGYAPGCRYLDLGFRVAAVPSSE